MVAYRFCRPDDIPLLVRAVNECWRPHFGGPLLTEESFRGEMKRLDVWPSNSMLALGDDGSPLAVSIGTKRPRSVLVHRLAARPGHERQGYGRHLVTSLSQKLAVMGPGRLEAEVPMDLADAVAFFEAMGWEREAVLTDRVKAAPSTPASGDSPVPDDLLVPVTVGELEAAGVLDRDEFPWQRRIESLRVRSDEVVGIGVVTPDAVEAWLVAEPARGAAFDADPALPLEILAAGARDPSRAEFLLSLCFRWLTHQASRPLRMARVAPDELPPGALAAAGFEPARRYVRYSARANPL